MKNKKIGEPLILIFLAPDSRSYNQKIIQKMKENLSFSFWQPIFFFTAASIFFAWFLIQKNATIAIITIFVLFLSSGSFSPVRLRFLSHRPLLRWSWGSLHHFYAFNSLVVIISIIILMISTMFFIFNCDRCFSTSPLLLSPFFATAMTAAACSTANSITIIVIPSESTIWFHSRCRRHHNDECDDILLFFIRSSPLFVRSSCCCPIVLLFFVHNHIDFFLLFFERIIDSFYEKSKMWKSLSFSLPFLISILMTSLFVLLWASALLV